MQWTAATSSKRLRQTVQNFLLWCVGSDQQCATGFFIKNGAMPEHGVTTFVTHFSWTIKLHTAKKKRNILLHVWRNLARRRRRRGDSVMLCSLWMCAWLFQCEFSLSLSTTMCWSIFPLKMWTYDVNKNSMHFSVSVTCARAPLLFIHDTFTIKNLLFSSTYYSPSPSLSLTR